MKLVIDSLKKQGELLLAETWKTSLILFKIVIPISIATKLLNDWGVTAYIGTALGPVMTFVGLPGSMGLVWATAMITNLYAPIIVFSTLISVEPLTVAQVTIIGMTMGIGYGGGLIIREAQSGSLSSRDIFFSLAFMGLMHSMIEDTLLMILLGGHVSGVLIFRFIFAMAVVFIMVRLMKRVSDSASNPYFFRAAVLSK